MQAPADATNSAIAREIDTRIAPEFNNRFVRVTREPATLVYRSGPPANRSFDPSACERRDACQAPREPRRR